LIFELLQIMQTNHKESTILDLLLCISSLDAIENIEIYKSYMKLREYS
jgi:hypothetical protein